jgi:hypothetical protein
MSPEQFALAAAQRKDASWTFHRSMSAADREAFDRWLVKIDHPLAYQPGTTWHRFQAIVAALTPARS